MKRTLKLRPVVKVFAQAMERQLRANDHKGGWSDDHPRELLARVIDEVAELLPLVTNDVLSMRLLERIADDIRDGLPPRRKASKRTIRREAADVANMVMMVADAAEALEPGKTIGDGQP